MQTHTDQDLLSVSEVARYLRVDTTTIRRWIKSGAFDAISVPISGKRWAYRIAPATLDALLEPQLLNSASYHS